MNFCYVNEKQYGEVGQALDPSGVRDVASKPTVSPAGPVSLATSSLPSGSDHPVMGVANKSVFCFCFFKR